MRTFIFKINHWHLNFVNLQEAYTSFKCPQRFSGKALCVSVGCSIAPYQTGIKHLQIMTPEQGQKSATDSLGLIIADQSKQVLNLTDKF